jgi:hypothetical protein
MYDIAFFIFKSEFDYQRGQKMIVLSTAAKSTLGMIQPPIRRQKSSSRGSGKVTGA